MRVDRRIAGAARERADRRIRPADPAGTRFVAAYSGSESNAHALVPAVERMRDALSASTLLLLWPSAVRMPAGIEALLDRRVSYPTEPDAVSVSDTVHAVEAEGFGVAVVFTETGWSPHVPAYIAYLAGIPRRYAYAAEFGGAVLSDPFAPPAAMPEEERHLRLLDLVGFERRRTIDAAYAAVLQPEMEQQSVRPVSATAGGSR